MSTDAPNQSKGLEWKWVIIAAIAGLIIVGAAYFIVAPTFHSPEIQAMVMLGGFVVTGAIIGYFSPGVTINEAAVGGALVMLIMVVLLYATGAEILKTHLTNFLMLLLGVGFSWVGGWAGEKLQGDESSAAEKHATHFQWKWVITGVVIGFALNVLAVFIIATVSRINLNVVFVSFLVSFAVTGFIVGYKSPGVTIKEPALAGVFAVVLDWAFIEFGIRLHVPGSYLVSGLAMGFLFAMLGAWLGEKYQESVEKSKTA